jgi:hypothetical protein
MVVAGAPVALAERWNGRRWAIASPPAPRRWDGARWTIGRPRYPHAARSASFAEVSCPSARSCTAVGLRNDIDGLNTPPAERWTPRGWTVQPTPGIGTAAAPAEAELSGVSCEAPAQCVAVGDVNPLSETQSVLAESYR